MPAGRHGQAGASWGAGAAPVALLSPLLAGPEPGAAGSAPRRHGTARHSSPRAESRGTPWNHAQRRHASRHHPFLRLGLPLGKRHPTRSPPAPTRWQQDRSGVGRVCGGFGSCTHPETAPWHARSLRSAWWDTRPIPDIGTALNTAPRSRTTLNARRAQSPSPALKTTLRTWALPPRAAPGRATALQHRDPRLLP